MITPVVQPEGEPVRAALVSFFERVARRERPELERLAREPRFSLSSDRWSFSLPALYEFLQQRDDVFTRLAYSNFRRLLYETPINHVARSHGAEVVIIDNRKKVDRSRYAMVWHAPASNA